MKSLFLLLAMIHISLVANEPPWSSAYQFSVLEKVGREIPIVSTYPSTIYPNTDYQGILKKYPKGKVLIFGYGSLMNRESALRSVSAAAVETMRPVVAFGFKRLFNYKVSNVSRWGSNLPENERAMLNIHPTTTYEHIINGVVMELTPEDLIKLIGRESGYDLVPIFVADWQAMISANPKIKIEIAYTFIVPDELRGGIDYTQTKYYPVRGYLQASREGALVFGEPFLQFWNETTYLGDGITPIGQWDEQTFSGLLDTREP